MAAQRRVRSAPPVEAADVASPVPRARGTVGPAAGFGEPAPSPVHAQLRRLEASFAEAPTTRPYPLAVRIAIIGGAPLALWAVVILGVAGAVHALHA